MDTHRDRLGWDALIIILPERSNKANCKVISQRARHTSENHHEDREDLLRLSESRDVAEADAGHAGQREVERRDVGHRARRSAVPEGPPSQTISPEALRWT